MREFLIEARKKKGLKQKDVAEAVGMNCAAYCNIEIGKRNPSVPIAKKIGNILGFEWTDFFKDE